MYKNNLIFCVLFFTLSVGTLSSQSLALRQESLVVAVVQNDIKPGRFFHGQSYLDFNGNGSMDTAELLSVPEVRAAAKKDFLPVLEHILSALPGASTTFMERLSTVIGQGTLPQPDEKLEGIDRMGSILASRGYQPFKEHKIIWLPATRAVARVPCRSIEWHANGIPQHIVIAVEGWQDPSITIEIPGTDKTGTVWLYSEDRVAEIDRNRDNKEFWKSWDKDYWQGINRFEWWDNGQLASIDAVPFTELPIGSSMGAPKDVVAIHTIKWNPYGELYGMYPNESDTYSFKGGIRISGIRWINWWTSYRWREVYVRLDGSQAVEYTFTKGEHPFITIKDTSGNPSKDYEVTSKRFDKDTKVTIRNELFIGQEGELTFYR